MASLHNNYMFTCTFASTRKLSHQKLFLRCIRCCFQVIVQPLLYHRQIVSTPLRFFFDVAQRFFNDVLSAAEFTLALGVQLGDHVVSFLGGKDACCGAYEIVPEIGFVFESIKKKELKIMYL